MSKHTPGPWSIPVWPKPKDAEDLANARLIAASPDLLAACEEVLEEYDCGHFTEDGKEFLQMAIKKAKGE